MLFRSDPELYYRSVTAHGTMLAYVFPTLIAMGFGYAVCVSAFDRPLRGEKLAWIGFALVLIGALMAGVGEELVFRGASLSQTYLFGGAVVFGLLHHIRRDLWPFTIWAVWQGLLFATALYLTELLFVTMVAHFLHDFIGFLIFRYINRLESPAKSV